MPVPRVEIFIDVAQFRNVLGQWAEYSEELERTRLRPWAEMLAEAMLVIAEKHIPSSTVAASFNQEVRFVPGPGGGTRIRLYLPEDLNRLAIWLLEGVAPHPIWPVTKQALWWDADEKGGTTKGAPNRPPKVIVQPARPVRFVMHWGFIGYDYITQIEQETLTDAVLGPGGIATKIGKDAEIHLTPRGPAAVRRGAERRVRRIRRLVGLGFIGGR